MEILEEESVESQKYTITHAKIETILSWIKQKEVAIPESIFDGTEKNYESFLEERRKLMAQKIKDYYLNL